MNDTAHIIFHQQVPLPPYCAGVVLAVLLVKRTHDAPVHPGCWSLIEGSMEPQDEEDPKRTAAREAVEEVEGIEKSVQIITPLCTITAFQDETPFSAHYYACRLLTTIDWLNLRYNQESKIIEGAGLALFTEDEIAHLPIRLEDRKALANFFRSCS